MSTNKLTISAILSEMERIIGNGDGDIEDIIENFFVLFVKTHKKEILEMLAAHHSIGPLWKKHIEKEAIQNILDLEEEFDSPMGFGIYHKN